MHRNKLLGLFFFIICLAAAINACASANTPAGAENLTWPDGTPVREDDEFDLAINDYSAVSELLAPGVIYEEGELPTLVDIEIRSDIGGLRELIRDYIVNVKGGTITPEVNDNWRITGDGI